MFKMDSKFMMMLSRTVDMIVLNLAFIILSIPVFTIGASKTALLYAMNQLRKEDDAHILKQYLKRFRSEFKSATKLWLVYLLIALWMILDLYALVAFDLGTWGYLMMAIFVVILALSTMMIICALGLEMFFENDLRGTLKNGFAIAVAKFPTFFFLLLLQFLPIIISFAAPTLLGGVVIYYSMIGFAVTAKIELGIFRRVFAPFLPEDPVIGAEEEETEDDMEMPDPSMDPELAMYEAMMKEEES